MNEHEPASLRSADGAPMVLEGVEARGTLRGLLFDLAVEQRYRNPLATNVEAVYTFPLPADAVLLGLTVDIGGRALSAVVVEKRAAEERYEETIEAGDTAVMLERAADGLCTLNLGNLMAGERASIRYRYAQLLRFEHGSVRLAVPTVIAPRYGDPAQAGLAPHQVPATDLAAAYPLSLAVDLEGDVAAGRLDSPSHPVAVVRTARGVRVRLAAPAFLDRDFVLNVGGLEGRALATLARDGDGVVALASFCAQVPADARELPLALRLLVDCSGSMAGDSIAAARRALHRILAGLGPRDRFALSRFGSTVRHETRGMVKAEGGAIRSAADVLARLSADLGGTEMESALRAVFAIGAPGEAGDVLAITDGEVWDAQGLVEAACAARQRVFVVGIGSAPAEGVLRRLADASGGACEFVAPGEDVEGAIVRMFARMRAPRVERAEVAWPAAAAWTSPLPAGLFGGETIHVCAGFAAAPSGEAALTLRPSGAAALLRSTVRLDAAIVEDDTLARVAAARRLPALDDDARLALALRYALLTDRTNLLVVAERAAGDKAQDLPRLAAVAQMHAAGWHGLGSVHAKRMSMRLPVLGFDPSRCGSAEPHPDYAADAVRAVDEAYDPGEAHARWPERAVAPDGSIDALLAAGLPAPWRRPLQALVDEGYDEADVCAALLAVLATRMLRVGGRLPRHLVRRLRRLAATRVDTALRLRVETVAAAASASEAADDSAWLHAHVEALAVA